MHPTKPLHASLLVAAVSLAPAFAQQTQPGASQSQPSAPAAASAAPSAPVRFDPSKSDEKAIAIADKVIAAAGGADRWAKVAYMKFTFMIRRGDKAGVSRTHWWDKHGQRSRMEGPSRDGKPVVAIVDHVTKQGEATLDGQLLFAEDARKYTDIAYSSLINDAYWLVMPFKLKDPGVRLRYDGELKAGPTLYDKVVLTFDDGTGLTSKDRYTLFVNRATSIIESWSYVLQGQGANTSPVAWQWVDYAPAGGLNLSRLKTQAGGEVEIVLEGVEVLDALPETVFTSTAPVAGAATPSAAAPAPATGSGG